MVEKQLIKNFLPPIFMQLLRKTKLLNNVYWSGDYRSWGDAKKVSLGYDSEAILEKVKKSLLAVKKGDVAYERDSVTFEYPDFDWPIIASLMLVSAQQKYLDVMDFGGSLGSTYFQNLKFLKKIDLHAWSVVEQPHFVKCGIENFQDSQLKFYNDIETCLSDNKVNFLLLSSVLPYLEKPYELLEKFLSLGSYYILIDKMPLIESQFDRLTVQQVPETIYKASYPAWFFSRSKFFKFIQDRCEIIADFDRIVHTNISAEFKGFLLLKKCQA